jgi:hypothetical protein
MGSNPVGCMDVCCECCVLSGRGLCDELITSSRGVIPTATSLCVCVCPLTAVAPKTNKENPFVHKILFVSEVPSWKQELTWENSRTKAHPLQWWNFCLIVYCTAVCVRACVLNIIRVKKIYALKLTGLLCINKSFPYKVSQ